jgi:hypothetical protein
MIAPTLVCRVPAYSNGIRGEAQVSAVLDSEPCRLNEASQFPT